MVYGFAPIEYSILLFLTFVGTKIKSLRLAVKYFSIR